MPLCNNGVAVNPNMTKVKVNIILFADDFCDPILFYGVASDVFRFLWVAVCRVVGENGDDKFGVFCLPGFSVYISFFASSCVIAKLLTHISWKPFKKFLAMLVECPEIPVLKKRWVELLKAREEYGRRTGVGRGHIFIIRDQKIRKGDWYHTGVDFFLLLSFLHKMIIPHIVEKHNTFGIPL